MQYWGRYAFLDRMRAKISGVDLVLESIHYAEKLATDGGFHDAKFIEINVLKIMGKQNGIYDIGFTPEGVLCKLLDLYLWAKIIRYRHQL